MKYKKFKVKDDELGASDLLFHAISVYDLAGQLAAQERDFEKLLAVGERISDASDRLIALAMATHEEEGNVNVKSRREPAGFSFPEDNGGSRPESI